VFGLARETVNKICLFSVPPDYPRVIDGILSADVLERRRAGPADVTLAPAQEAGAPLDKAEAAVATTGRPMSARELCVKVSTGTVMAAPFERRHVFSRVRFRSRC
jgi:hypothetical protein